MKVSRHKKFQRYLTFFKQQFLLQPPYQILIDGTFANAVLAMKVNMKEQLPKYFDDLCNLLVTPCTITETEKLGPSLYGAVQVLKALQVYKCQHVGEPIPASSCLKSIARKVIPKGPKNDRESFIVATQDAVLREHFRKVVGVPLIYLHGNAPTMEKPSDANVKWTGKRDKKKLKVSAYQKEILNQIKDDMSISDKPERKGTRKRKRAGPNPLSCKKSNKGQSQVQGGSSNPQVEEVKKRKRVRIKVPKHVKELKNNVK